SSLPMLRHTSRPVNSSVRRRLGMNIRIIILIIMPINLVTCASHNRNYLNEQEVRSAKLHVEQLKKDLSFSIAVNLEHDAASKLQVNYNLRNISPTTIHACLGVTSNYRVSGTSSVWSSPLEMVDHPFCRRNFTLRSAETLSWSRITDT